MILTCLSAPALGVHNPRRLLLTVQTILPSATTGQDISTVADETPGEGGSSGPLTRKEAACPCRFSLPLGSALAACLRARHDR